MRRALRITRRLATVVAAAALAAVAAPAAGNAPAGIEADVTAGGVALAGLSWSPARQELEDSLRRPVRFALGKRLWSVSADRFQVSGEIDGAVTAALRAERGAEVPVRVSVVRDRIRAYVDAVASDLDTPAQNARLAGLEGLRPVLVQERAGRTLDRKALVEAIEQALLTNQRGRITLALRAVQPEVRVADLPPVVVIQRESKRLHLYESGELVRSFPIATGRAEYPTPLGEFTIVDMQRHPWWYPPPSDWAKGQKPVPPGPDNPLGTRWMGFDRYMVGIHGTSNAASIGTPASHGCVRMYTWDAEWMFERIRHGTPVFVLPA
jgi:lipoprotein-anchoring transpeptidase ErfK/SrfK